MFNIAFVINFKWVMPEVTSSELSMGRLDQAQNRLEPENASPNPARTRK